MVEFYLIPNWFFGFGLALELIFGLVTLAVALYSFKVYKYCLEKQCKLFGFGFLALAFSYFSWAGVSWYVQSKLNVVNEIISLGDFAGIVAFGVYTHVFFFLIGLVTLTYFTLNVKSQKIYTLLVSVVLVSIIFSAQKIVAFYFISALLLLYILVHYMKEYKKGSRNQLMLFAFLFLFLGTIDFAFSAVNHIHYVGGHILYLIGYLFILINFILMLRPLQRVKNRKKK